MSWPIPIFTKVVYPKPISWRLWLPALVVVAACAAGAVLLLWPHSKSTQTLQFWASLVGAPLIVCALAFGARLDQWEDDQANAEEFEKEQRRLKGLWSEWARRGLCVIDAVAFPAATAEISDFASAQSEPPTVTGRSVTFDWAENRASAFRRTRLLHLIAHRLVDTLRLHSEVVITLMLDDASLAHSEVWSKRVTRVFSLLAQKTTFQVEVQSAKDGIQWIARQVDMVDPATRLVIAAQLWPDEEQEHEYSEGAAAFLIVPDTPRAGVIFRPMKSEHERLATGLAQIKEYQVAGDRLAFAWFSRCEEGVSTGIRSALTQDPKDTAVERLLDKTLGLPGPASGWISLAIAMEAMRGGNSQLVVWREHESESIHLCTVSPLPQKETTV